MLVVRIKFKYNIEVQLLINMGNKWVNGTSTILTHIMEVSVWSEKSQNDEQSSLTSVTVSSVPRWQPELIYNNEHSSEYYTSAHECQTTIVASGFLVWIWRLILVRVWMLSTEHSISECEFDILCPCILSLFLISFGSSRNY